MAQLPHLKQPMYIFSYTLKKIEKSNLVLPVPRVFLEVKTASGYQKVPFLLDSGADTTSFPIHPFVPALGVGLNRKRKTIIGGIEGKGVTAYPHELQFQLGTQKFVLNCFFVASNTEPLLGRQDFWKLFSITFDNQNQLTILTSLKKSS